MKCEHGIKKKYIKVFAQFLVYDHQDFLFCEKFLLGIVYDFDSVLSLSYFAVLGIEPMASHMQDRHSATGLHSWSWAFFLILVFVFLEKNRES